MRAFLSLVGGEDKAEALVMAASEPDQGDTESAAMQAAIQAALEAFQAYLRLEDRPAAPVSGVQSVGTLQQN